MDSIRCWLSPETNQNVSCIFIYKLANGIARGVWSHASMATYIYLLENQSAKLVGLAQGIQGTLALSSVPGTTYLTVITWQSIHQNNWVPRMTQIYKMQAFVNMIHTHCSGPTKCCKLSRSSSANVLSLCMHCRSNCLHYMRHIVAQDP